MMMIMMMIACVQTSPLPQKKSGGRGKRLYTGVHKLDDDDQASFPFFQGSPGICSILPKIFTLFRAKSVIFPFTISFGQIFEHLRFHTVSRSLSPVS